jgi:hypothetical protein
MIAFEISIDGRRACTAGVPAGVTSVIATWVRRPSRDPESGESVADSFEEELTLEVGGLTHDQDGASVHLDPPRSREREDPTRVAGRKREYYQRLKREHGEA